MSNLKKSNINYCTEDVDVCPKCGCEKMSCKDSRNYGYGRRRVKECTKCGHRIATIEITVEDYKKITGNMEEYESGWEAGWQSAMEHSMMIMDRVMELKK